MAETLFARTRDYVQAEMGATLDEYRLLEEMNSQTAAKYVEMKSLASGLGLAGAELRDRGAALEPLLAKVDALDEKVARLEELAYALDAYSKRLEAKFKALDKPKAPK